MDEKRRGMITSYKIMRIIILTNLLLMDDLLLFSNGNGREACMLLEMLDAYGITRYMESDIYKSIIYFHGLEE